MRTNKTFSFSLFPIWLVVLLRMCAPQPINPLEYLFFRGIANTYHLSSFQSRYDMVIISVLFWSGDDYGFRAAGKKKRLTLLAAGMKNWPLFFTVAQITAAEPVKAVFHCSGWYNVIYLPSALHQHYTVTLVLSWRESIFTPHSVHHFPAGQLGGRPSPLLPHLSSR